MSRTRRRLLPSHPSAPRHPCISGSLHLLQRRRRSLLAEPRASAALASGTPEFASNRPIQADRLAGGARIRRNRRAPVGADWGFGGFRAWVSGAGWAPWCWTRSEAGWRRREKFSASRGVGGKSRCDRRPCISHPKLIQWLQMFYLSGLQIQTSNRPDIQTCSKPFRH